LKQAAPLRPLPDGVTSLDQFRVHRRDRAGGVIHDKEGAARLCQSLKDFFVYRFPVI
jgi:hypothetical protein